jgi:hypothetical protein
VGLRVAQALLAHLYKGVAVDGVLGPKTAFALLNAPEEIRELAISFISPKYLPAMLKDGVSLEASEMLDQQLLTQVVRAIKRAADRMELPVKWLVAFAFIESRFNRLAINGSSKGLFQMQPAAWADARQLVVLPDFSTNWLDPYWNALAAAAYMRLNMRQLKAMGLDVSSEPRWLYMAHQQGAAGLISLVHHAQGLDCKLVVKAEAMRRNPAPGTAPTTDALSFYNNWMSYLEPFFKS